MGTLNLGKLSSLIAGDMYIHVCANQCSIFLDDYLVQTYTVHANCSSNSINQVQSLNESYKVVLIFSDTTCLAAETPLSVLAHR